MPLQTPRPAELQIAAGAVALLLFAILFLVTGHWAALVAGCGGGLLLLASGLWASRRPRS